MMPRTTKLSRLQRSILVYLAECREQYIERTGYGDPVYIRWRGRRSFYGGVHPFARVLMLNTHYTAKERAAVSRSLKRLEERGLLLRCGDPYTVTVRLLDDGIEVADRLRDSGDTAEYRDLFPDGLEEVRVMCYKLMDDSGLDFDGLTSVTSVIDTDPVKAYQVLIRWV